MVSQEPAMTEPSRSIVSLVATDPTRVDPLAIEQLHASASLAGIERIVGLPDLHAGRGIAVGAAFWSRGFVHPHLVGSDIGCGMALWRTDLKLRRFRLDAAEKKLHGLEAPWDGDHPAALAEAGLPRDLYGEGLGSIGGGNHFAEALRVEALADPAAAAALGIDPAQLLLLVHSGSRGLGQAILDRHLAHGGGALAEGTDATTIYLAAHDQAVRWAELNRAIIAARLFDRLGIAGTRLLDICHNSVTPHAGGWLHRKGAAPADKGAIVIPGSRGALSYVVQPLPGRADEALHSLAHGAGRRWSRSDARDRIARRFTVAELARTRLGSRVICEDRALLYEEAPEAYQDIHRVVADLVDAGLVRVIATLRPLITYKMRRS
jgi:release factor H-coupled RctB family protein